MLANQHSSIRIQAVKLLQGIATRKSAELLVQLLKDDDNAVKRQAMIALRSLVSENLEPAVQEQINAALAIVSEKEGWILK
jgi:HEAT repeat protein